VKAVFAAEFSLWNDTVQVSPYSSTAHNGLGLALFHMGTGGRRHSAVRKGVGNRSHLFPGIDEAITYFVRATQINPYYEKAHFNLGLALSFKGRMDEAIAQCQEAVRLDPNDTSAQNFLASLEAMAPQGASVNR
jgi:tetratricopeptide (TPR) repeat protein